MTLDRLINGSRGLLGSHRRRRRHRDYRRLMIVLCNQNRRNLFGPNHADERSDPFDRTERQPTNSVKPIQMTQ